VRATCALIDPAGHCSRDGGIGATAHQTQSNGAKRVGLVGVGGGNATQDNQNYPMAP
jgi:hypothetical protein